MVRTKASKDTIKLVDIVNRCNKRGIIKLMYEDRNTRLGLTSIIHIRYNVRKIKDIFLRKEAYIKKNAYLYINDYFYEYIQEQAALLGYDIKWNNIGTTGWLVAKE